MLPLAFLGTAAPAEVRVTVEDVNGQAAIQYECTAGEVVRAFALDVSVATGEILGIADFFRGEGQAEGRGYGIFPASFRDYLTVTSGSDVNWEAGEYTPLAAPGDLASDTLPGLNSSGVTLEFAALWDPNDPASIPAPSGILRRLQLSEAAQVSVAANLGRGGVVAASADATLTPVFAGGWVNPVPAEPSLHISLTEGIVTIDFQGGELETATDVEGPWSGTGNSSGQFTESVEAIPTKFYRVHHH